MVPNGQRLNPRLESQLVSELRRLLLHLPVGAQFSVPPSADICSSLELFLPELLRSRYPEWVEESLDGVFVARAQKTGRAAAQLVGTCILISDQTVTPFFVELELAHKSDSLATFRVLVGEPGGGPLGISGPGCNSQAAKRLLANLTNRLDRVMWSYTVTSEASD